MAIELKIPEIGESITEVQIAEWLKAEGDAVQKDEPVAVIDSEKTTFELPAPEGGTLSKIFHQAGATVSVGEVIGQLDSGAGSPTPAKAKGGEKSAAKATLKQRNSKPEKPPAAGEKETQEAGIERRDAEPEEDTPADAKAARPPAAQSKSKPAKPPKKPEQASEEEAAEVESFKEEVDEASPAPAADAQENPAAQSAPPRSSNEPLPTTGDGEEEIIPMSMLRRTVARRLVEAKQQMAMLTTFNEVDMSAVQALRQELRETFEKRHEAKLGLMSFFVKAAVDALRQFPQLNAEVRGNDIVYRNYFNIGVAIATGRGLVVPVLRRAERMSFAEIEKAIGDFVTRAKDGKLKPEELEGATFTLTNGGVFGSLLSTPIISPPQSGILGMHAIQERPVAVNGQVVIRPMMYLALTYDHRLVDGREAVLFLRRIKEIIEVPARMLLEV